MADTSPDEYTKDQLKDISQQTHMYSRFTGFVGDISDSSIVKGLSRVLGVVSGAAKIAASDARDRMSVTFEVAIITALEFSHPPRFAPPPWSFMWTETCAVPWAAAWRR